jgi:carbohydrate binding protein with CBM6 domain
VLLSRTLPVVLSLAVLLSCARLGAAATLTVNAGGSLQAAIDAAKPGDVIELQAGATFDGPFKLRAKSGMSATSRITIRSANSSGLPAAGTRITTAAAPLLAKIRATSAGPAIRTDAYAAYWTLMLLEFLPSSATSSANLVEFGGAGTSQSTLAVVPHHLVLDRCYLHGNPTYGQRRGLALNSGDTQVVNSHFSDFKGVNQDTQAILGWNGPGPFWIENNYLEAAGENIMFGGSDPNIPNLVPTGITIRRNLISKPLAWVTQSWTVKNLVEFKNAQDALVEGNTIENNWAAGQQGYSILFTPRNQSNTAPWVIVKNVTVQNNVIRHVAAVFNVLGYDDLAPSQQTQDITVRNNLIYDVSSSYVKPGQLANGRLAIIGGGPKNITFDHNTVDNNGSSTVFFYGGKSPTGTQIAGFELTNNLLRSNSYAIYGDKIGEGTAALTQFTPNPIIQRNTFAGESAKLYPTGNDYPALTQWLADFVGASAANYQLAPASLSNNRGTDGVDLGVNFTELSNAMNGVSAAPTPAPAATPVPAPEPTPEPGLSTPRSGSALAVPATIQMENYDNGGHDIAYYDATATNDGGAYRTNGVDIGTTTDTGGGYLIGWTRAGEWLAYTVSVASARTYAIDVRVASNGAGGTFHIEVNGVDKTGPLAVPNTGGWQTWKTITKTGVTLSAGTQVIRVVMNANGPGGSVGNFNWFAIR